MRDSVNCIDFEPIALIGLPRSGTTWIGKIFDSHPETLYLHEPDSAVLMKELPLIAEPFPDSEHHVLSSALTRTLSLRLTRVVGILPQFKKSYRTSTVDWFHRRLVLGGKLYSRFVGEVRIPDLINTGQPVRLVWKSVESLGRLGLIARAMTNSRVIHILRHPGAWESSFSRGYREKHFRSSRTEWSVLTQLTETTAAKRRGLTITSFKAMSGLERNVWSWVLWNEHASEACSDLTNVLMIKYEDVCAAPIAESQRMFKFSNLTWHEQTERFILESTSTHKDGFYGVFRNPSIAANRWRHNISSTNLKTIESILADSEIGRYYLETDVKSA